MNELSTVKRSELFFFLDLCKGIYIFLIVVVVVCSLRVEGTIPGFDVTISDRQLTSLVKVSYSNTEFSLLWCCVVDLFVFVV